MKRNDDERRLWVLNDEGLYNWQQSSHQSVREFIRENRKEIDAAIDRVLNFRPRN
jgi:hypothetical protein